MVTYVTILTQPETFPGLTVLPKPQLTFYMPLASLLFVSQKTDAPVFFLCYPLMISIAKTTSKKIGALIHSMKFFSPEVALYLYKSTIRPCMEYCCQVWTGAPNCYLELLDKLQKQICRTVGLSLATSIEPFTHH